MQTCLSVDAQFIFKRVVLEHEVLLQAVAPPDLLVIVHDVVVKVDVCPLLILLCGCLRLLMPLQT